jgi:ATP-dependent RNA helicase DeaD
VPQDEEYYVHRIGRTARAGRKGRSFTFVSDHRDLMDLEEIQKYINAEIVFMKTPDIDEANGINDTKIAEDIKRVIGDGGLEKYMPTIDRLMSEDYTSAEIAAALIKLMHVKVNAPEPKYTHKDIENTGGEPGMARFRINAGKDQGIRPGDIVGAIAGESGIHGSMIGAIKIKDKHTYVDIPFECAMDVINVMHDNKIKGKKIKMEPAKPDKQDKKHNKKISGKKPNKKNKKDA